MTVKAPEGLKIASLELGRTEAPSSNIVKLKIKTLFEKNISQLVATFLEPKGIAVMRETCKDWRHLDFRGENIDLSKFENLSDDNLKKIIDEIMRGVPTKNLIKSITLPPCTITDASLEYLAKKIPSLTSFNLTRCERITDAGLAHLVTLPLNNLNLSFCVQITDAGLGHLVTLPLNNLNLSFCVQITDAGLAHLVALPLNNLNLSFCVQITDAGLAHLVTLPLNHLNLEWCLQITDAGLAHLVTLPLNHLNLAWCWQITDAGLAHLVTLPLNHLNLTFCRRITNAGLAHLTNLPLTLLDLTDYYIYVLATTPKGGDRWGELHRFDDLDRLRLAHAIAIEDTQETSSFKSWIDKTINILRILDETTSPEQEQTIDALIGAMPDDIRNAIDYQIYTLAPEPKGGDKWGQLHRHDDPSRLRLAVIEVLKGNLFSAHPIKPKEGLKIDIIND